MQSETHSYDHWRFDCRATDFAITLGRVHIAQREKRGGMQDGQEKLRPFHKLLDIDIATVESGRDGIERTRLGRSHAHYAAEWLQGNANTGFEISVVAIQLPDLQVRLREVTGQQAKTRNDARPSPLFRPNIQHLNL